MDLSTLPTWIQYCAAAGLAFQAAVTLVVCIFFALLGKELLVPPTSERELQDRRLLFELLLGGFPGFGPIKARPSK